MLNELFMLVLAIVAIVYSILKLWRTRRPERRPTLGHSEYDPGVQATLRPFLASRGRRYMWYLLIVATFLAGLIVKSMLLYLG